MNEILNFRFYTETRPKNTNKKLNKYGVLTISKHTGTYDQDKRITYRMQYNSHPAWVLNNLVTAHYFPVATQNNTLCLYVTSICSTLHLRTTRNVFRYYLSRDGCYHSVTSVCKPVSFKGDWEFLVTVTYVHDIIMTRKWNQTRNPWTSILKIISNLFCVTGEKYVNKCFTASLALSTKYYKDKVPDMRQTGNNTKLENLKSTGD
jgi:hypothetical protein